MQYRWNSTAARERLLNNDTQNRVIFLDVEFNGGIVRMHTSRGDKMLNGEMYKGVGEILSISDHVEEEGTDPSRINISLIFDDNTLFADLNNTDPTGNEVTVYIALYDDNWQLIESTTFFQGDMDAPQITEHGSHFTVTATITDFFEIWQRAIESTRMSDAAHQAQHSGDKIFDQVEILAKQGLEDAVPGSFIGGGGPGGPSRSNEHRSRH